MNTITKNTALFFILLIVVMSATSHAQEQEVKPTFGFRMAPNIGWVKPDASAYDSEGITVGFSWGFIAEFPMAENYSFSTGFNILFNSGKLSYPHQINNNLGVLDRRYGFKYLELPLMLRLFTSDRGGPMFYGQIGLGTGILLDARGKDLFIDADKTKPRQDFDKEKITDEIKLFRAALIVGLGIEYPLGPSLRGLAGLSFNNGFSDVLKGSNVVDNSISHKAFNSFVELNLGLLF